ncbi:YggS family pyridoxal phosphate-dependent enzyme [candidate division KSB1 bacterium]
MSIAENINIVHDRIKRAAERSGRDPVDVKLIAVTKTHPASTVDEATGSGITDIGENRVQEALKKYDDVKSNPRWHLIGHLQRNKVKHALKIFDIIHSVDSVRLAAEIDKNSPKKIDILVEVNIGEETAKSGADPDECIDLLKEIRNFENLNCIGLMTIPPWEADPEDSRQYFRDVAAIKEEVNRLNIFEKPLTELSMGMTGDFEVAIEEGATMVRVGTAIFGQRQKYKL